MRKLRVVILDDELFILNMLKDFFVMRGYEVLSYSDATTICPLYGKDGDHCSNLHPCSDVLITDFNMPGVNGVELLQHQRRKGCKLDIRNKAVISGYIDDVNRRAVDELGCMFFKKPFTIFSLADWLTACETRTDLSRPLATRRREERFDSYREITLHAHDTDEVITGIALNISQSGFCLKVATPLRREDTISIRDDHSGSRRKASVRWVRQASGGSYLAGLQCPPLDA